MRFSAYLKKKALQNILLLISSFIYVLEGRYQLVYCTISFLFFSAGILQVLMEEGNHFHLKLLLKAGGTKFCTYFSCWHINVFSGQWQFLVSVEAHNWSLLCFFLGAIIFFVLAMLLSLLQVVIPFSPSAMQDYVY